MNLQATARKLFGDRAQEMLDKRAEMTEHERNNWHLNWHEGTAEDKALRAKIYNSLSIQFDIVELKFCFCKSCGVRSVIPIYELTYATMRKYDGVDTAGKAKFKEEPAMLSWDRVDCDCCADGAKATQNAKMMMSLLVKNEFEPKYESVINSQKSNAVIPSEFRKHTFQNWKAKNQHDKNIKQLAIGYADRVARGSTRKVLVSQTSEKGAGYVGVSILNKLCVDGKSVRYIDYAELSTKIFNKEYKEYLDNCAKADVVMVAGIRESNDRVLQQVVDIMQHSVMVFTTSEKGSELKNKIGDKYFGLLVADCELIKIENKIEVTQ